MKLQRCDGPPPAGVGRVAGGTVDRCVQLLIWVTDRSKLELTVAAVGSMATHGGLRQAFDGTLLPPLCRLDKEQLRSGLWQGEGPR